jgi:hypothetical protein
VDAVGLHFRWADHWPATLAQLAERKVVDRTLLLDACLARLQRPGRPTATAAYLAVHEALSPTTEEVAQRLRDYLALLPDALSTVATMAQERLVELDRLGRLPVSDVVEASRSILLRSEKKLVRAQLTWLGEVARRDPTDAGRLAEAAAVAFTHPAVDMQRAAVRLVTSMATRLSADARAAINPDAVGLPSDLRTQIAAAFGERREQPETPTLQSRLTAPVKRELVAVESAEELAEHILIMITSTPDRLDTSTLELVLEGLVRYAGDPDRLRAALAPVLTHDFYPWLRKPPDYWHDEVRLNQALSELIAAVLNDPPQPAFDANCGREVAPIQHAIIHRILRLADAVRAGELRTLISFPTWSTGALAWQDLLSRLERAAREDHVADPFDLDQALLRLEIPDADVPEMTESLRRIDSPAALYVADRLDSEPLLAPVTEHASKQRIEYTYDGSRDPNAGHFTIGSLRPMTDVIDAGWTWALLTGPRDWTDIMAVWTGWGSAVLCWPAVLPRHREVVATYLVPAMARLANSNDRAEVLPLLAEADGPLGHGMMLALSYALSAKSTAARNDAVDALLILAARRQLDGTALGHELGHLVVQRDITASRIVAPLRDAAQAGAGGEVQFALVAVLEAVLAAGDPTPQGLADLIALAAELAEITREPREISGLAAFAARRGGSRQLVEARRLQNLTNPT